MPAGFGFSVQPRVHRKTRAGACGGAQRKDGMYVKQYNWFSSGQPIVYPYLDAESTTKQGDAGATGVDIRYEYAPAKQTRSSRPDPTASWSTPLPGVRCGSVKRGRLLKPGHLKAASVAEYETKTHIPPSRFISVRGRNFGWVPPPLPPPDPAPDEEKVEKTASPTGTWPPAAVPKVTKKGSTNSNSDDGISKLSGLRTQFSALSPRTMRKRKNRE